MKITTLIMAATLTVLSSTTSAKQREISVGLGHTHGSPILGIQYGYKSDFFKSYASVGLIGVGAGIEFPVSKDKKHTLGATWGKELLTGDEGYAFLSYSYHFKSFSKNGFVAGLGIGAIREQIEYEQASGHLVDNGETDITATATLILGYKF
jgi:hypothetical protein